MKRNYHFGGAHHFLGVTFPDGNRKQDRMISFAFSPEFSCPADAPCRSENGGNCYYQQTGNYRPSVAKSALRNWQVYATDPGRFWKAVRKAVKLASDQKIGFRPFEGGDIPFYAFFVELMKIAQEYPGVMHGMTKQYAIVNRYIEEHGGDKACILRYYHLRFSEWPNYPMDNRYGMPTFSLTFNEDETTCLEQKMKMLGHEWSCQDCHNRKIGCYSAINQSIKCIDHTTEAKIVRQRGLWKKEEDCK